MSAVPFLIPANPFEARRLSHVPQPAHEVPEGILARHRGAIYSFLRRKGFTAEEADDLTQETLIRAYQHLTGFRGVSMAAWLYRIAGNVAVDHLRKQRLSTVPLESMNSMASGDEDPILRLHQEERRERVMAIIGELPECHQRILKLRFFEDRSLAEIAAAMSCTPMAAKLRVFRAVTALRKRCQKLALGTDMIG